MGSKGHSVDIGVEQLVPTDSLSGCIKAIVKDIVTMFPSFNMRQRVGKPKKQVFTSQRGS